MEAQRDAGERWKRREAADNERLGCMKRTNGDATSPDPAMLLSAPLITTPPSLPPSPPPRPPYEIMQLQTSIRSCEGNHYVVTVINDAAENSGATNNSCAHGAFEGRGPVAKETDEIQNDPTPAQQSYPLFFSPLSLSGH